MDRVGIHTKLEKLGVMGNKPLVIGCGNTRAGSGALVLNTTRVNQLLPANGIDYENNNTYISFNTHSDMGKAIH